MEYGGKQEKLLVLHGNSDFPSSKQKERQVGALTHGSLSIRKVAIKLHNN